MCVCVLGIEVHCALILLCEDYYIVNVLVPFDRLEFEAVMVVHAHIQTKPNQTKEGAPSYINLLNDTLDIISKKGLFIIITVVVVIYCFVFNEQNMFASIMLMYSYNIRAAYVSFNICCRFCCSFGFGAM